MPYKDNNFKRIIIWVIIIYLAIGAAYYYFYSKNIMDIFTWGVNVFNLISGIFK